MLQIKNFLDDNCWLEMVASEAKGKLLVKDGLFAADMLKFEPGQKTSLHTHPGDHILFVVIGSGLLRYDGLLHELTQYTCYFVPGSTPHQVIAGDSGMYLLSISNNHKPVDSAERLKVVNDE